MRIVNSVIQQINLLEETLDVKLFHRSHRRLTLRNTSFNTDAGCCKKLTHDEIYQILLECK